MVRRKNVGRKRRVTIGVSVSLHRILRKFAKEHGWSESHAGEELIVRALARE
jgi:hypothetical protein